MSALTLSARPASFAAVVGLCLGLATAVSADELLFDTWTGFVTGDHSNARFPWAATTGDLNGDLAPDVVVAQWPWATGFACLLNQGDGRFADPVRYASTLPAVDIAVGDLDHDQDLDVVVPDTGYNYEGTTISVYLNLGDGTFGPAQALVAGTTSFMGLSGIVIDDFDQDQNQDLAVAKLGFIGDGTTVAVLLGDGAGGFGAPQDYPAGPGPYKLAAGDLNGDGYPDLGVANWTQPHSCTVMLNDGAGGFLEPVTRPAGSGPVGYYPAVALADVDNDDDLDLLFSNSGTRSGESGAISLFRNQGEGSMSAYETIPGIPYSAGPVDIEVTDIDQDGWKDLLGAHFDARAGDGCVTFLNDGSGGFLPATLLDAGHHTVAVMSADVDLDADPDILTADNYSMAVTVHLNEGGGVFDVPPHYLVNPVSQHMDAADIDLDGDLDVLTTGGIFYPVSPSILHNNGDGTFAPYTLYALGAGSARGKLRLLNDDAYPDMLIAGGPPYSFYTAMNNGDGTFAPFVEYPVPSCGGGDIDVFDLDGDTDLDVVYLEYLGCPGGGTADRIFISLNRGDGTFDPPYWATIDIGPYSLVGGDFDGDKIVDLATANYGFYGSMNVVDVLLGLGNGTFLPHTTYVVPFGPKHIVAADLDGDLVLDLATCNTGQDAGGIETTSVLTGRGDGTFNQAVTYIGSFSPELLSASGIAAGDPDDDGDQDLMVTNAGSNDICFYTNRGDGTFETPTRYGVGKSPSSPLYADFTGDFVPDLAAVVGLPPSGLDAAVAVVAGLDRNPAAVAGQPSAPAPSVLLPVSPNPFTARTRVDYQVGESGSVRLRIYDAAGRAVATLHDGFLPAGSHHAYWNGRDGSGRRLGAGVYFFRLEAGATDLGGKVVLF